MEELKYELTNITMDFEGEKLYRIKALKDFKDVKKGDLGGWVSNEDNLSQYGDCWIYDEAKCTGNSRMYRNSAMYGYSEMHDNSVMYGDSKMYGYSEMHGDSAMHGNSSMYDNSAMYDDSEMYDNTKMHDNTEMHDNSRMCCYSIMHDDSAMYNDSEMHDNSRMYNDSILKNNEKLYGKLINKVDDFIEIYNKEGRIVTCVLKDKNILYNIGCQKEIDEKTFIDRIYNEGGGIEEHPYRKEYLKIIEMSKIYFKE